VRGKRVSLVFQGEWSAYESMEVRDRERELNIRSSKTSLCMRVMSSHDCTAGISR